ncbi:glycosyltransferase family 87 protein [Mycobacterium sp.]|uniref:glycosyltransferase family 87 protein n=1 Tax=Mycobacterium sp. TaxID=1785 RepID=UPI003F96070F
MNRPPEVLRSAVSAVRAWFPMLASQSERNVLLGTVLVASAISAATGFVLTQYYSIDVLSSLVSVPEDCFLDWGAQIGRHCFSDYGWSLGLGMEPNPWGQPYPLLLPWYNYQPQANGYPAAAILTPTLFGLFGRWLHAPQLGLLAYVLVLTVACLIPAIWAARGARGLERVVVFVALGAAAIPAWMTIDRGNSVGFVVPILLVFLVALRRRRWGLVAIMVVLAALVKPQFAVLGVALLAARQWRLSGLAVVGVLISNLAAYLLWPRDFPKTIAQSGRNMLEFGSLVSSSSFQSRADVYNVAFGKGLLLIPDAIKTRATGGIPDGFLAGPRSMIGSIVLVVVVVSILVLGRRIPPVMAGIALLATASLFPAVSARYYLVFVLPVAALLARDPDGGPGSGLFDRLETIGGRRRAVGFCVSLAAALTIAQIALPGAPPIYAPIAGQMGAVGIIGHRMLAVTTVGLAPLLWLIACAVIIISYARKPAPAPPSDRRPDQEDRENTVNHGPSDPAGPTTGS